MCMYVCECVCVYTFVCLYMCVCVCWCVCVCVCWCVCARVRMSVLFSIYKYYYCKQLFNISSVKFNVPKLNDVWNMQEQINQCSENCTERIIKTYTLFSVIKVTYTTWKTINELMQKPITGNTFSIWSFH